MTMLGDVMSELNIQKLSVVAGTDFTKPPQPLPLSIERMDKLERLTLVDFQNVRFDETSFAGNRRESPHIAANCRKLPARS